MTIKGIIFDMDGTLIDSQLDFDQMRLDLNLPENAPILETIESYTGTRRQQCNQVLRQHEQIGVEKATQTATPLVFRISPRRPLRASCSDLSQNDAALGDSAVN